MVDRLKIVAVGLLTQQDLDMLGRGFRAAIPVEQAPAFEQLLRSIDDAELRQKAGSDLCPAPKGMRHSAIAAPRAA